jgi:hypothetical protein
VSARASAIGRAARFVAGCGDETARLRAAVLAGEAKPERALPALERWTERSGALRSDGSVSALASLPVLGALADLRLLDSPLGRRLAEALARVQAEDGSFGAATSDADERVFATGRIGGWLSRLRSVRQELLDRAGDHLAARFTPESVGGFAWRPLAAHAQFFANVVHERSDEVLQWCGRELERGYRARRFDAVATARVLVDCGASSLPGARLDAGELVLALVSQQDAHGAIACAEAATPESRALRTLDALAALVRLG